MKQIGARQEAGRIGGIGACGRELCCASWISSFSSVTTNAARVQDISLNPQKLAGQCSKLKCCLVYEYDTYADARRDFPRLREPLQAMDGEYYLVKSDILARTMSFSSSKDAMVNIVTLPVERVKEIIALNRAGKKIDRLQSDDVPDAVAEEPTYRSEEDSITRFDTAGKCRGGRRNRSRGQEGDRPSEQGRDSRSARSDNPQRREHRGPRSESGERNPENRGPRPGGGDRRDARGGRPERQGDPSRRGNGRPNLPQGAGDGSKEPAAIRQESGGDNRSAEQRRSRNRGRGRSNGNGPRPRDERPGEERPTRTPAPDPEKA